MRLVHHTTLSAGLLAACVIGCGEDNAPADQPTDGIQIVNDDGELSSRLIYRDENIPIVSLEELINNGKSPHSGELLVLTLVAELPTPVVSGHAVQATSISIKSVGAKSYATVSYNLKGEVYRGAVSVLDISDPNKPQLASEAKFFTADIHAARVAGSWLYMATGWQHEDFSNPAVVYRLGLDNSGNLSLSGNKGHVLTSFAANSIDVTSNTVVVSTGDVGGGVFVFDEPTFSYQGWIPLTDTRWVASGSNSALCAAVQGTQGTLTVFDPNVQQYAQYPVLGVDGVAAKNTVEVAGSTAVIAAGSAGVQVHDLASGAPIASVPVPDAVALNLDPAGVVSNATSVDGDTLFVSNGIAGVWAAGAKQPGPGYDVIGQLQFKDFGSANHVAFKSNYLIVAAGTGGVKIVKVEKSGP